MKKRLVLTGATGLLGGKIAKLLIDKEYSLTILTTNKVKAAKKFPHSEVIQWDYLTPGKYLDVFTDCCAVIHLAGAGIVEKRWSEKYKKIIMDSRVETLKSLIESIKLSNSNLECFISTSATGFYGDSKDEIVTESFLKGAGFLSDVCEKWENESRNADTVCKRRVNLRLGVVLSNEGGAFPLMKLPFSFLLGGTLGSGKQWVPWIHIDDCAMLFIYALENNNIRGIYNVVSPNPEKMFDFAKLLGETLSSPSWFRIPAFLLKLVMGESSETILASQRVVPNRILASGYRFKFEKLQSALKDLCSS